MSGYIGNIPVPQATQTRESFTATASQTTFNTAGYTPNFLDVFLNGVHLLNGTDYTATNGSDVVLTTGAAASDVVEVISYSTYEVNAQTYTGGLTVNNDGATALTVDRATSDGSIVDFKKSGTTVGSIGTGLSGGSEFGIKSDTGELQLATSYNSNVVTWDGSQLYPSASNSLGFSGQPWQDLYLSGGVYLGGTGAANKLDDYEEGTFNLALSASSTSNGYVLSSQNCKYIKIGNVCYVTGEFNFSTVPSSYDGAVGFTGLPFTSGFSNSHQIGVAREVSTSGDMFVTQVNQNSAEMGMNAMDGITNTDNQGILANKTYSFSNTYITT